MQNISSDISQIIQLATGVRATSAQVEGWTAAVNNGTSLLDVAKAFVASDAFAAVYHVDNTTPQTTTNPLAPLFANIPNNNPISGLIKSVLAPTPTPFADTAPSVTLTQEIIDHALGQHTNAQVAGWANSGHSVAEVFLAFAQNVEWASTVIVTNDPNFDGVLPDGEFIGESGFTFGLADVSTSINVVGTSDGSASFFDSNSIYFV